MSAAPCLPGRHRHHYRIRDRRFVAFAAEHGDTWERGREHVQTPFCVWCLRDNPSRMPDTDAAFLRAFPDALGPPQRRNRR